MKARTITIRGAAFAVLSLAPTVGAQLPNEVPAAGELGGPVRPLTIEEWKQFLRGRELFDRDFMPSDGLGFPDFNANSCRACHEDPVMGGAGPLELNVSRFGFDNGGQGPFQDAPGGQAASKLQPPLTFDREEYDPQQADVFEQRQTPALFGLGLMESISEAIILSNEDPTDLDGDGVFGVARMVPIGGGGGPLEVGRFGWKAQIPTVEDFVRDAMGAEAGITTPDDGRGFAFAIDADSHADPELSEAQVDDLAFFLRTLAPPPRTGSAHPGVVQGEFFFERVGCTTCHIPSLPGDGGPVPLYSDLLLHDVMPGGFRGMGEPGADVGMYRTPPLWGVRHSAPYMHDGRASTLRAAIEAHDGEAAAAKAKFLACPPEEQEALLMFLRDL